MLLLVFLGGTSLTLFLGWILYIALLHRKFSHLPGPQRTSFFLGNAILLKSRIEVLGNLGSVMLELMLQHGELVLIWRVTNPTVIIGHLPTVKEYYTNLKLFRKPKVGLFKLNKIGKTNFVGNHSILSDPGGSNWEHKKRIMDPGFRLSTLQGHISKFYLIGEQVATQLECQQTEQGFVDIAKVIAPFTINAISSAGFGVKDEKKLEDLSIGTLKIANYWVTELKEINPLKNTMVARILGFSSSHQAVAERELKRLRAMGRQLILERVEDSNFGSANDALDFIILANECEGKVNMERCVDDFLTLYEAGNITTSTTLSFVIAELVRNPYIQETLIKEVEDVWVDREISRNTPNEEIMSALKDMVYLDAVLNETLRHHSPVVAGMRALQQEMEVLGYILPAGSFVSVSQQALHHHPQYWNNPNTFDPGRFLDKKEIVPFTFLPFIVGPRRCLGKNFAMLEMKIFIAIWMSRFKFEKLPDSTKDILTEQSLLVRMLDNRAIVRMRN